MAFHQEWQNITMDPFILNIIQNGYSLIFDEDKDLPGLSHIPLIFEVPRDLDGKQNLVLETQKLVEKGAVEIVLDHASPSFYSYVEIPPSAGTNTIITCDIIKSLSCSPDILVASIGPWA